MDRILLKAQLERHEGLRLKPYRCTAGKLTIGYGRNLEDVGISNEEAGQLLDADIERVEQQLGRLKVYSRLDPVRQAVLANMAFNLGIVGLLKFAKMLQALSEGDYHRASLEMLDSRWSQQVGSRATELANIMRNGVIE